jgi:hypothetical protein
MEDQKILNNVAESIISLHMEDSPDIKITNVNPDQHNDDL